MEDNEQFVSFFNPRELADELFEDYTGLNEKRQNNIFNSIHLGVIEECEKDKEGNYNGKATVRLVTTPGVRTRCLIPVPSGQAFWFGGFPPAGSLCQVAWLPLGVAIITAIYPFNYRTLLNFKRFVEMVPGEVMVQACSGVLKEEQKAAGRMLFDRHGRIELETVEGSARVVLGDPGLANGLTALESDEPETGQKTILRIQAGNATINITDQENVVIRTGDGAKIVMEGDDITITCDRLKTVVTDGKRLATEDFVLNIYNSHTHTAGAMVSGGNPVTGVSGAPISKGTNNHLTSDVIAR